MSQEEMDDFRQWHDKRLIECGYPPNIVDKLTNDRERWFGKPKDK